MWEQTRSGADQASSTAQVLTNLGLTLLSVGMLLGSFLLSQLDAKGVRLPHSRPRLRPHNPLHPLPRKQLTHHPLLRHLPCHLP